MPTLKTATQKSESIRIGANTGSSLLGGDGDESGGGGKWEDEEERRFFEEFPDLKDYVPRSVLGLEGDGDDEKGDGKEKERQEKERVEEEVEVEEWIEEYFEVRDLPWFGTSSDVPASTLLMEYKGDVMGCCGASGHG